MSIPITGAGMGILVIMGRHRSRFTIPNQELIREEKR
jgi:hypothetical protein